MASVTARNLKSIYRIRVSNLPWTIATPQLKQYFSQFGFLANATVMFDKNTGLSRGVGFIDVTDKQTFNSILSKQSYSLEGSEVYVRQWIEPSQ